MKSMLLFLCCVAVFDRVFCQTNIIKDPALSLNFTLTDFKGAGNIQTNGIGHFFDVKKMQPKGGMSLAYMKGVTKHVDFVVTANGCFINYPIPGMAAFNKNMLLLDVTGSLNLKLHSDQHVLSPYVTIGAGVSKYDIYYGITIPAGVGIQLNYKNDVYLLLQSVYSFGITGKVNDYLRHSLGIAGNIKRKRPSVTPLIPTIPAGLSATAISDRDRDGIIDSADRCPDIPGLIFLKGCPDLDGDSIPDIDDQCPALYGIYKYKGCPIPDADNDGSNDEVDSCINEPGPLSNHGCPVIDSVSKDQISAAAHNIFFETGSAKLLMKSHGFLNKIYQILIQYPSYVISVEGHTDSVGTSVYNQDLSEKRAKTVMQYLVDKGIAAPRIIARGFGESSPIDDNKATIGRSRNRRVEIVLKLKL